MGIVEGIWLGGQEMGTEFSLHRGLLILEGFFVRSWGFG